MKKRLTRILSVLLIAMLLLTACGGGGNSGSQTSNNQGGNNSSTEDKTNNGGSEDEAPAGDGSGETTEKVLRITFGDTPTTLSPFNNASDYELVNDIHATLYREVYDVETQSKAWLPCLAEGDPVPSDDMLTWTVKMHEGYTFANGDPITANDFAYSFKMLNDPKLANRNITLSDLVNGEAYLAGECAWEDVGFKVLDDYTLQFTFEKDHEPATVRDMRAFFWMGTGVIHQPTFEATLNADGTQSSYGSSVDTLMSSGLYVVTQLIEGQSLVLERRTDGGAPMADIFTPDRVEYTAVSDPNTVVQLFEQGKLSYCVANQDEYANYSGAHFVYTPNNYGIFLNSRTPSVEALKDVNLRLALYWGLDRDNVVPTVYGTAMPSAYLYMPYATMPDPADPDNATIDYHSSPEAQAIRIDGHPATQSGYDPELAKEYMQKAYENNGNQKIAITALYSDYNDKARTWAEAVQSCWNSLFDPNMFELSLQATANATMYEENLARTALKYDICIAGGWYQDPSQAWNNTNWVPDDSIYAYNSQYCIFADDETMYKWNELFEQNALGDYKRNDQGKLENAAKMEEILYNDCSFIPCYSSGNRYFFADGVRPIVEEGDWSLEFYRMQTIFE